MSLILDPYRFGGGSGDPYFANVVSLIHFDDSNGTTSPVDVTGKVWTAAGNAAVSTTAPIEGTGSALLDGNGDYFSSPDHADFTFAGGDFTFEQSMNFAVLPANAEAQSLFACWRTGGTGHEFFWYVYNAGGTYYIYLTYNDTVAGPVNKSVVWTPSATTRYNMALSRIGPDLYFLVDGAQVGATQSMGSDVINDSTDAVVIGASQTVAPAYYFNGKQDEHRITKGVGRYSGNYTPAFPFPDS